MKLLKNIGIIAAWIAMGVIGASLSVIAAGALAYWTLIFMVTFFPWY